jgi:Heavy metal binding domain
MNTDRRRFLSAAAGVLVGSRLSGQDLVYQCPMDPEVRSNVEGLCPRCGMKLRAGIPDPIEFPMDLKLTPPAVKAGEKAQIEFSVLDAENSKLIEHFQIVHEKLFHLFVISQDLQYFVHDHPTFGPDGKFRYEITFPKPGLYRLLGDFYPDGATPQLIAKTIIVLGGSQSTPSLNRDYSARDAGNMQVSLETDPPDPIAGTKTMMFFKLNPGEGLEKYIGAWGHMLAASDDLIDLIHTHPFIADGGPNMQFNVYFPRPRTYRVWVQFQRIGVVNTAYFDIPAHELA